MARGKQKLSPAQIATEQMHAEAVKLRLAGLTFQMIANQLGLTTRQGAIYAVKTGLHRTLEEHSEELRVLTSERLTAILAVHWPLMVEGDMRSTDRCLAVVKQLRELHGLDAPAKVDVRAEVVVMDATPRLLDQVEQVIRANYRMLDAETAEARSDGQEGPAEASNGPTHGSDGARG